MSIPNKQRRLDKLKQILVYLNAEKHVQNRTLKTWLTAEQYAQMLGNWTEQKTEYRNLVKPAAIIEYEDKLRAAIALSNRADSLSTIELRDKAISKFEDALEYLQEIINEDVSLRIWFDRNLDFNSTYTQLDTDAAAMPRVITSRSLEKIGNGFLAGKQSKRQIKIAAVESAIAELAQGDVNTQEETALLRAKLAKLKASKY